MLFFIVTDQNSLSHKFKANIRAGVEKIWRIDGLTAASKASKQREKERSKKWIEKPQRKKKMGIFFIENLHGSLKEL